MPEPKYEFDLTDTNPNENERTVIETYEATARRTLRMWQEEIERCDEEITHAQTRRDMIIAKIAEAKRQLGIKIASA